VHIVVPFFSVKEDLTPLDSNFAGSKVGRDMTGMIRRKQIFNYLSFSLLILSQFSSGTFFGQGMEGMKMDSSMQMAPGAMQMNSSFSLNLPMNRDGSGTSWQPDRSPMMMYMFMKGNTTLMFHGAFYLRYTWQDVTKESDRGGQKLDGPNWVMFMLQQKLSGRDLFSFNSMFSFDILTEGGYGYPLLFQTGEAYHDVPLVDRQHPHDLFAELAVNYTHSFTKDLDLNVYLGYPGEPALGPNVFMHRLSAMNDPDAPLGHHWQDATHITFGVGTLGFRYKWIKAEGSIFNGREPDDIRYNFDPPRFDSYSYRLSANPGKSISLQFSQGFLESPEALEPDVNVIRTTASVSHTQPFMGKQFIASSLIWGMNHLSTGENLQSLLFESNLKLAPLTVYMRYEFVQKDASGLQLTQFTGNPVFNINAITLGLNRILFTYFRTDLSAGIQATVDFPPGSLKPVYGEVPLSAEIYIRLSPAIF
jgi:hypothetical protein